MQPQYYSPITLPDYELLDSGSGEKLERWGQQTLRRPDPQALWRPRAKPAQWDQADLRFERQSDRGGRWIARSGQPMPPEQRWKCAFMGGKFWIQPTPFKHVGAFPEQAPNWACVQSLRAGFEGRTPRLLNLFGYTGVASVLAALEGYEVTHVDASRAALDWARDNAQASGLGERSIRWVLDDALAYAAREVRRGSRYDVVLLDPPHYGRGPKGQKWQLETGLPSLLESAHALLAERALMVLSTYAVGYSPLAFAGMLGDLSAESGLEEDVEAGELALPEPTGGRALPAGFCARLWRGGLAPARGDGAAS